MDKTGGGGADQDFEEFEANVGEQMFSERCPEQNNGKVIEIRGKRLAGGNAKANGKGKFDKVDQQENQLHVPMNSGFSTPIAEGKCRTQDPQR